MEHQLINIHIRRAAAKDAAKIGALFQEHLCSLDASYDPLLDSDMSDIPSAYESTGGVFIIAETDTGALTAMGGLMNSFIKRLHVQAAFRRQGIGSQIIRRLISEHQSLSQAPLQAVVDRNNQASRSAFFRCGFRATGIIACHSKSNNCEILELPNNHPC